MTPAVRLQRLVASCYGRMAKLTYARSPLEWRWEPVKRADRASVAPNYPLLQKYEDKGLETLIIDMDFYVEEDAEPGVFTPGTSYEGYSWMFTRESKDDTWTLEENGFLL